jgi:predicted DNA-binding transcriptional regulator AlpA
MTLHPLMNRTQAVQYLGISIATFWRLAAAGDAPPHIQLSRRRVGYRQQDLDADSWGSVRPARPI